MFPSDNSLLDDTGLSSAPQGARVTPQAARFPERMRNTPQQAVLTLPSLQSAVRDFRNFADNVLGRWKLPESERASALLIVSELAGNAAVHGRASTSLYLARDRGTLDIEVMDSGACVPDREERADIDPVEHGRGMYIVEVLASEVVVRDNHDGRTVRVGLAAENPG